MSRVDCVLGPLALGLGRAGLARGGCWEGFGGFFFTLQPDFLSLCRWYLGWLVCYGVCWLREVRGTGRDCYVPDSGACGDLIVSEFLEFGGWYVVFGVLDSSSDAVT